MCCQSVIYISSLPLENWGRGTEVSDLRLWEFPVAGEGSTVPRGEKWKPTPQWVTRQLFYSPLLDSLASSQLSISEQGFFVAAVLLPDWLPPVYFTNTCFSFVTQLARRQASLCAGPKVRRGTSSLKLGSPLLYFNWNYSIQNKNGRYVSVQLWCQLLGEAEKLREDTKRLYPRGRNSKWFTPLPFDLCNDC